MPMEDTIIIIKIIINIYRRASAPLLNKKQKINREVLVMLSISVLMLFVYYFTITNIHLLGRYL